MSQVIDSLARHLQERTNKAEARVAELETRNTKLEAALRPFAREHTHAEIAPRAAFARIADLVSETGRGENLYFATTQDLLIQRQAERLAKLEEAIREYLAELDNPVMDSSMRHALRGKLRRLVGVPTPAPR